MSQLHAAIKLQFYCAEHVSIFCPKASLVSNSCPNPRLAFLSVSCKSMNLQPRSLTQPRTGHQSLKEWTRISDVDTYSPRYLQMMVDMLPKGSLFCVSGIGSSQLEANLSALLLGGHARVGLEDNLYLRQGELASNVQLTERIVRIMRDMDLESATPAEAREMLRLPRQSISRPEFSIGDFFRA